MMVELKSDETRFNNCRKTILNIGILPLISLIILILFLFLSGCAPVPQKKAAAPIDKPLQKAEENRSISVLQKMRTQAISRRVGRWAVVIGISDYKYDTRKDPLRGIPDLRYASRDATAFADFLKSPAGGAFAPDHIMLLTDRKATIRQIRKGIGDFLAQSLEDDLVIIFFAGHGTPDPGNPSNLYLLAYDTEPGNYYGTALPMWEFDIALNRTIHSKRVFLFVDACRSAGVGGTRAKSVSESFNKYMAKLAGSKEGITKITASRSDELSLEKKFPEGGHGLFTYYLLKGLKGEADDNSDGFVTMKEAYDYLYDRVRSESRHSQNPWASAYVSDDIPLGISDSQVLSAIRDRVDAQSDPDMATSQSYQPPAPAVDLPADSAMAVKLAQAKLAKDEPEIAREIVEAVLNRNDAAKPDALALKVQILIADDDLKAAEDTEDLLVIPYPNHPAAKKGAKLIYDHYLSQVKRSHPEEKLETLQSYLNRHPFGPLTGDAKINISNLRSGLKDRYQRSFNEQLTLAKGFMDRKRFDRVRDALDQAEKTLQKANDRLELGIAPGNITRLQDQLQIESEQHRSLLAWTTADNQAKAVFLNDTENYKSRITIYEDFISKWPNNPHKAQAKQVLEELISRMVRFMGQKFYTHFGNAKNAFILNDYTRAYNALAHARKYGTPAQIVQIDALTQRYNSPPEVKIKLSKEVVDWETPIQFDFAATDREGDPVRVVSWEFGDGRRANETSPEHTYAKWHGQEKQKTFIIVLKVTDDHSIVEIQRKILVKKQDRIKTFTIGSASFKMIRIPAGTFMMGSPSNESGRDSDEIPQHRVTLTKDFWMGQTEVTQALWQSVMGNNPSSFKDCGEDCPVEKVSWNDAQEFIRKLNRMVSGSNFRLPTEAEWEYAARAGSTSRFSFGDDEGRLGQYAWYSGNAESQTHVVAQKKPNAWGLFDMHGNVREWCQDWYGDYPSINVTDPDGPSAGAYRVIRGGSWSYRPGYVRSADRSRYGPDYRSYGLGFRLARN